MNKILTLFHRLFIGPNIEKDKSCWPSVGIGVIVWKDRKILIGEGYIRSTGRLFHGVPGGHWESRETLVEGAKREVAEEAGLQIDNVRLISVYEFYREDKWRSYLTIGMQADWVYGTPRDYADTSSDRRNWRWCTPEEALAIPDLFPPDRVLIERCISGVIYESP